MDMSDMHLDELKGDIRPPSHHARTLGEKEGGGIIPLFFSIISY